MTKVNYLTAPIQDVVDAASQRGLSTDVTTDHVRDWSMLMLANGTGERSELEKRMVIAGRIGEQDLKQDCETPKPVLEYFAGMSLVRRESRLQEARVAINSITDWLSMRLRVNGAPPQVTPHYNLGLTDQSYIYYHTRPSVMLDVLIQSGIPQIDLKSEMADTGVTVIRGGEEKHVSLWLASTVILAFYAEECSGVILLLCKEGDSFYKCVTLLASDPHTNPEVSITGSRFEFANLHGAARWLYTAGGGIHRRVRRLPLNFLGITLSKQGLLHSTSIESRLGPIEHSIDLSGCLSGDLIRCTDLHDNAYQTQDTIHNTSSSSSFSNHITTSLIASRIINNERLYLDQEFEYSGPAEFAEDPLSASLILCAKFNKRYLGPRYASRKYKATTEGILGSLGILAEIAKNEAKVGTKRMIDYLQSTRFNTGDKTLSDFFQKRTLLDAFDLDEQERT